MDAMRFASPEIYRLNDRAQSYSFPFHSVDPRASAFNESLYEEILSSHFPEFHAEYVSKMREERKTVCPTREDITLFSEQEVQKKCAALDVPEDVRCMIADPRVFVLGVMSPEVHEHCERIRKELSSESDRLYGRWAWHFMEEIPLLGKDAEDLTAIIRNGPHDVHVDGSDVRLWDALYETVLHDCSFVGKVPNKIGGMIELYKENDIWTMFTMLSDGIEHEARFTGFEVRRRRR